MRSSSILTPLALSLAIAFAVALLVGSFSRRHDDHLFFQFDLTSTNSGDTQVFFDAGHGINLEDSVSAPVQGDKQINHVRLTIPPIIFGLRFDPINLNSVVTVSGARISNRAGTVIHRFSASDFTPAKDIKQVERHDDTLEITCSEGGGDPYLFIAVPPTLATPFVLKNWLEQTAPAALATFIFIIGLLLAASRFDGAALRTFASRLHFRPLRNLATLTAIVALIQFHPLFFSPADLPLISSNSAKAEGPLEYFRSLNSPQTGEISPSAQSYLASVNIFSLLPSVSRGAHWARQLSIFLSLWAFIAGCAFFGWFITRSVSVAALICGCAALTHPWPTELFPLSPPAIASAPWILLAWAGVAQSTTTRNLFLGSLAVVLANTQLAATEQSTKTALLFAVVNVVGVIYVALGPKTNRNLTLAATAITIALICLIPGWELWPYIYSIPRSSAKAEAALLHLIPVNVGVSFFERFMFREVGSFEIVPPTANIIILAGLVWALVRAGDLLSKPTFLGILVVTVPIVILASGILPDYAVAGWLKADSAAMLQYAAWYTLVLLALLLAIFGFSGIRQLCTSANAGVYITKASVLFFVPIAVYIGTVQQYAAYSFKMAHLGSIVIAWVVAHVALVRLRSPSCNRSSMVFIGSALLLACWYYNPYAHYFLHDVLVVE